MGPPTGGLHSHCAEAIALSRVLGGSEKLIALLVGLAAFRGRGLLTELCSELLRYLLRCEAAGVLL